MIFNDFLKGKLEKLQKINRFRTLTTVKTLDEGRIEVDGKEYINLSSNDYLNIASSIKLKDEFLTAVDIRELSFGSTSSRLMTGNSKYYDTLELMLANLYEKEASLVFSSGYHLNSGLFQSLARKGDLIISDKLNHASIIDGIRLSPADYLRYPHCNYKKLEEILGKSKGKYKNVFVVVESVFSMDGDLADLKTLVKLKKKYNFILIVDEAHGFGVFGEKGQGLSNEESVESEIDIIIGTFGKAAGGMGAFLVCSKNIKEWLVNSARPFIFTTAIPPVQLKWLEFSVDKLINSEVARGKLLNNAKELRLKFVEFGMETGGNSQIVPVMAGKDKVAVEMAVKMRKNGFFVFPVRPPTVPEGKARLRISITSAHTLEDLLNIPKILKG